MSIYFSGSFKRSAGVISAITKQLKLVNLKPAKKIYVQFDPFHPHVETIRDFLFHISGPKVTATNLNCAIKTTVVCDRSEPFVKVELIEPGDTINSVKFLTSNLTVLEILQQFNKHISSLAKPDETVNTTLVQTKSEKKKAKRK